MKLLLKACRYIITQNPERTILQNQDILIEGNKIKKIGHIHEACPTIDCSKKLVLPGLINLHTHTITNILRGLSDDLKLQDWLQNKIFPAEAKINDVYYGALLTCIESIKAGVTCTCDMSFMPERIVKAFEDTHMRGIIGRGMVDLFNENVARPKLKETEEFIASVKGHSLIIPAIAPHAPNTCSEFLLKAAARMARKHSLLNHIHILETLPEAISVRRRTGKGVIRYLESIGFLDEHTLGIHMCWLKDADIATLAKHRCSGVHCPVSNQKLASGAVLPLIQLQKANVRIALGTDSNASNNSQDMFEEMKQAGLLHKSHLNDPTVLPAQAILDMATVIPAEIARLNAGWIAEGRLADLITLPIANPRLTPLNTKNILSNIVYSASGSDVADTIINGRLLMKNRELVELDEEQALKSIQEYSEKQALF
jgi:5-methylthioadenosine/S-adenosylhomocysteine deaminase